MKKLFSLTLTALMLMSVISLAGCGEAQTLKLGLGAYSVIEEIKNAEGDQNGTGEAATTVAAVLLDEDGKIVKCQIDTAANSLGFTADGKAVAATEFKTKAEMGDAYNMKAYGGAKKEWYEQVDAFESFIVGKTINEVKALKKDDKKGTEDVQTAGCTIMISDFVLALEKAVKNASESKATADDTLKLGIVSSSADAKDATEDAAGVNEVATTFVAKALNKDGVITAAKSDAVSTKVEFDTKGASKSEFGKEIATKNDLGDNYGMKAYGGAKKEWYEQTAAFDTQIIGKKSADVASLADNTGKPGEELQTAGCTVNVNDMIKAASK